jgi:hypothetical protein
MQPQQAFFHLSLKSNTMKKLFISTLLLSMLFTLQTYSQSLLPALEEMPLSREAYLNLKDGQRINGKIMYTNSGRGVNKVALKDDRGTKHEFKAPQIEEFGIFSNDMVKLQYFNESSASIKAMLKTDRSAVKLNDYVVFRNASLKDGKELLLQLLNPHFDERIQVYHSVNSRKTTPLTKGTITLTGEMQRAYLVSKDSAPVIKVKKGSYKKSFKTLFSDCPNLLSVKNPKFKDFGKHIYYYTENCGAELTEYFRED